MASKQPLKIGVLSTGWVAGAHAANWQKVEGAEVVAVCSRRKEKAASAIETWGCGGAAAYDSLDEMLKHDGLDVVSICTPHVNHPDETIRCAEAGKHIVIEKPVALNREDLRRTLQAVEKAGVLTSVCFELHWIGSFKLAKSLIAAGTLGNLFYGECSYHHGIPSDSQQFAWGHHTKEKGGGAFYTAGCHALDALIYLVDSEVQEVAAMSNTSRENPWGYEYDPNAVCLLRFANGAIGKVGVSVECHNPYHFPVVLQGDRGTLVDNRFYSRDIDGAKGWIEVACDLPASGDVAEHPYQGQFEALAQCIREEQRPHNDLRAAAHVHDVMFAIDEAISLKKMVQISPTTP